MKVEKVNDLICIICPRGCQLHVTQKESEQRRVSGNACPRGETYAINELTAPVRMLTSTVKVRNSRWRRCPVKTTSAIPKEKVAEILMQLDKIEIPAPVAMHQVICQNICGLGVDIVATKEIKS